MEKQMQEPAAAQNAAANTGALTVDQGHVREAIGAVVEVLNGAPTSRVLELSERISVAKVILREIAAGSLIVGRPPTRAAAPRTSSRESPRQTKASASRK